MIEAALFATIVTLGSVLIVVALMAFVTLLEHYPNVIFPAILVGAWILLFWLGLHV